MASNLVQDPPPDPLGSRALSLRACVLAKLVQPPVRTETLSTAAAGMSYATPAAPWLGFSQVGSTAYGAQQLASDAQPPLPEEPPGTEEAAPPPPPPAHEQAQATAQAQAQAPATTAPAVDQAQVQAAWSAYYAQQAYFQQQQQAAHYGTCTLVHVLPTGFRLGG